MLVPRPSITRIALATVCASVLPGCGGNGYGTTDAGITRTTSATSNAVAVADNHFTPNATTVAPGTTVTWTWTGASQHNVTFDDGAKSATQSTGTYQRAFAATGSYPYHCTIHGTAMSGVVTVR